MGQNHIRAIARSHKVKVAAIAEPSPINRASCEELRIPLYPEADALLQAGGLDGVLIAVPSPLHLEFIERCAAAKLPVLCEKPCGTSSTHAKRADTIARQFGIPLQIAYWRRFVPTLRALRERIAAGELGELYLTTCYQWDERPPAAAFRMSSGGIFVDMGVHEIDQMRWLTGAEIVDIQAVHSKSVFEAPIVGDPDSSQALCQLSNGDTGFISLGRRFPPGDSCWVQVFGTKGSEEIRFLAPPDSDNAFVEALRLQVENFAAMTRGGIAEGATAEDALAALVAAERAAASLRAVAT